jgi:hypothetical protein
MGSMAALECLMRVRTMPKFLDSPSPYCPEQRNNHVLSKCPPNASTVFPSSRAINDQSTRPSPVVYLLHWGRIGIKVEVYGGGQRMYVEEVQVSRGQRLSQS